MKVFVGTSGWQYSWNKDQTLDWYLKNSGLNSVELNASFYRFPFPNQVKSWKKKTENLDFVWSIKVNRLITHIFKFNEKAFEIWKKFEKLFEPLDEKIDFYLFQLPPIIKPKIANKIEEFYKKTKLENRFALECRNLEWFNEKWINWARDLGITFVSIDAPYFEKFPREIYCVNGIVYLRMHGRTDWYFHYYTVEELKEIKGKIIDVKPKRVYVYFNNNHNMLLNAQQMFLLLKGKEVKNDKVRKIQSELLEKIRRIFR